MWFDIKLLEVEDKSHLFSTKTHGETEDDKSHEMKNAVERKLIKKTI